MKIPIYLVLINLFFSCHSKQESKSAQVATTVQNVIMKEANNTIESFSEKLFTLPFKSLANDSSIKLIFKIVKETEESEGVEWESFNLYKQKEHVVKIENNWEDKSIVSRITFYGSFFKTKHGISDKSHFSDVKNLINISQLNNSTDGELALQDKDYPQMNYTFDVDKYPKLYNGVSTISDIPDSLKVYTIVVFRK